MATVRQELVSERAKIENLLNPLTSHFHCKRAVPVAVKKHTPLGIPINLNKCAELRSFRRGWMALRWHKSNIWQQIRTTERCCLALYPGSFCSVLFFFFLVFSAPLLSSLRLLLLCFSIFLALELEKERKTNTSCFHNKKEIPQISSEFSKIDFPWR